MPPFACIPEWRCRPLTHRFWRAALSCCLALAFLLPLGGCSPSFRSPDQFEDLPDAYTEGADFPERFSGSSGTVISPCEEGYYYFIDDHVYFLDGETLESTIACNKPDCIHGEDCNAYFSGWHIPFFQYYDGKLYVADIHGGPEFRTTLYEFDPDSGTRKELFEMPRYFEVNSRKYMLHRGYLYLYSLIEEDRKMRLERFPLDRMEQPESELLYEADSYLSWGCILYGDRCIFGAFSPEDHAETLYQCNLKTGETTSILTVQDDPLGTYAVLDAIQDNSVIYHMTNDRIMSGEIPPGKTNFYAYSLTDGTNRLFYTAEEQMQNMQSNISFDGKNIMDVRMAYIMNEDPAFFAQERINLLDENLNPVKSISPGVQLLYYNFVAGDEKVSFLYNRDAVYAVDKRDGKFEMKTLFEPEEEE